MSGVNVSIYLSLESETVAVMYELGVQGLQAHTQNFRFVENLGKIWATKFEIL